MTALDAFNNSMKILGYSDENGNAQLTRRTRNRAEVLINLVYKDLFDIVGEGEFTPIESLNDEIKLPRRVMHDIFPFGLCLYIAQSEGDGGEQALYSHLYNKKRASLSRLGQIKDTLPTIGGDGE